MKVKEKSTEGGLTAIKTTNIMAAEQLRHFNANKNIGIVNILFMSETATKKAQKTAT